MDKEKRQEIKEYLFKDPNSKEANDFIKTIEEKIKDTSIKNISVEELYAKVPEELKTDKKQQEEGIEKAYITITNLFFSREIQGFVQEELNKKKKEKIITPQKETKESKKTPENQTDQKDFYDLQDEILNDNTISGIEKIKKIIRVANKEVINNKKLTPSQKETIKKIKEQYLRIFTIYDDFKRKGIKTFQKNIDTKKLSKERAYQKIENSLDKILPEEADFNFMKKIWPKECGNPLEELKKEILNNLSFFPEKKTFRTKVANLKNTHHINKFNINHKRNRRKTTEKKEEKIWLKALAGSTGFITGIGLNVAVGTVPILGAGLAIYSGARTLYNTTNLVCNISTKINKGNEPKIITKIKEKIPNKVKETSKLIFEKPKNPYLKWFVNGMTLGYTMDKIFNIHKSLAPSKLENQAIPNTNLNPQENTIPNQTTATSTPTTPTPIPKQENIATSIPQKEITTTTITPPTQTINATSAQEIINNLKAGTTINISELEYGYAGPGQKAVHLLNERGINAVFDKTNTIDGQVWIHFKQENGAGYAWFPKEQVEEIMQKTLKRGIH